MSSNLTMPKDGMDGPDMTETGRSGSLDTSSTIDTTFSPDNKVTYLNDDHKN